eukprot:3704175-Pleurochrysis_carterae.AAC.3
MKVSQGLQRWRDARGNEKRRVLFARTTGINHCGACRRYMKMGELTAPWSAGCFSTCSPPASRAARRSRMVRLTSSLASRSSCACEAGTSDRPMMLSLSCTGGGPPSATEGAAKHRETEKVEQGGEANTVEYSKSLRIDVVGARTLHHSRGCAWRPHPRAGRCRRSQRDC